jgi:hypothetical protein
MANRYAVNILKNEGATIITLTNASFVAFAPPKLTLPKLTLRVGPGDIDSLVFFRNRTIKGEVRTYELERRELGLWVSPPFRAGITAAGERPLEFELAGQTRLRFASGQRMDCLRSARRAQTANYGWRGLYASRLPSDGPFA